MNKFKHIQNSIFNINGYTQTINPLDSALKNFDNQTHFAMLKVATEIAKDLCIDITGLSDFDAVNLVQENLNRIGKEIVVKPDQNAQLFNVNKIRFICLVRDKLEVNELENENE